MMKKSDLKLIRILRNTKNLAIEDIRLLETHCKLGVLKKELPADAEQNIQISVKTDDDGKSVVATARYKLTMRYDDRATADPPILISARYGVRYSVTKAMPETQLKECLENIVQLNIWPYWREYVQSVVVRMGLPPFPMPLMDTTKVITKADRK